MNFLPASLRDLIAEFGGACLTFGNAVALAGEAIPDIQLSGIKGLSAASASNLSFLSNSKLRSQVTDTKAAVVLITQKDADALGQSIKTVVSEPKATGPLLWVVANPYLHYALIQQWWVKRSAANKAAGIHPSAVVDPSANVAESAYIGANAVIGQRCTVGAHVEIGAGAVIGYDTQIGQDTVIHANVTVYHDCHIGQRVIVHSGAVIGADGFGFAPHQGTWVKIPQVGRVIIGDDAEIGANTSIDRGALEDTVIGLGVKLDNQIQIAHNVTVGEHTAMAGCVGVAGSAKIGARCTIGGAAMILGHLTIVDGTHVSSGSLVMSSIKEPGAYSGFFPLDTHKNWEKTAATLKNITELRARVRALEKAREQ